MDGRLSAGLRWAMPHSGGKKKPPAHSEQEKSALGRQIAAARKQAGFTQEAAATDLGVIKQTVSSWEKGRNLPDALWLRRLARLYQTSVNSLVGDGSSSAEAMRVALLYDALQPAQRAVFMAMWNAYVRQLQSEGERKASEHAKEFVESAQQPTPVDRVPGETTSYSSVLRRTAPKRTALDEAARYAENGNDASQNRRTPRRGGGRGD